MKAFFCLISILVLFSCRKNPEEFLVTGKFVDDITGEPVNGSGVISIEGHDRNAGTWFGIAYSEALGSGVINNNGVFSARFKKWNNATDYYCWLIATNDDYFYPDYLDINKEEFINGRKDTTVRLRRYTDLKVNFHNTSPVNDSDRLTIGVYPWGFPDLNREWENLQNCEVKQYIFVYGGVNAQGTLSVDVPADVRILISWQVGKNGIYKDFLDSVVCPRNTVTTYNLNY